MDNLNVSIYIKCKCKGNPRGAGEAAAVLEYIDKSGNCHIRNVQLSSNDDTKNAIMLKICIAALKQIVKPCKITFFIDSNYIINSQNFIDKWKQDGWKKANGKELANNELWERFYTASKIHEMHFKQYADKYEYELNEILKIREVRTC